jgi:hypothetical protein
MDNLEATVLQQYANSPILLSLIENLNSVIDPTADIDAFYNNVFQLSSAIGFGLDYWGTILGVNRILTVSTGSYLSFKESTNTSGEFGQSPFYTGETLTQNFALSDDAFRVLLFAKAAFNITNCSCAAINQILLALFPGRGNCYVIDNLNLTFSYNFQFTLQPFEISIVQTSGVLPRTSGVATSISFVTEDAPWLVNESGIYLVNEDSVVITA